MNWLQKTFQVRPKSYTEVGHGYGRDENGEYKELFQLPGTVLLWYYENDKINITKRDRRGDDHFIDEDRLVPGAYINSFVRGNARGRIDLNSNQGSIVFHTDDFRLREKILDRLISEYPGIKFYIFNMRGGPYTIQQYLDLVEAGQLRE